MTLPAWAAVVKPLLSESSCWTTIYRATLPMLAMRQDNRLLHLSDDAPIRRALLAALPEGSRVIACRALFILDTGDGISLADGEPDATLPEGIPDGRMPDLFCRPEAALALPPGAWSLHPNRLSAHGRLSLTRILGPLPEDGEDAWVVRGSAGAVWGRADPRFSPEAVARS